MRIELGKINQSWGKQGENNSVELAVDVSAWKSEYPSGAPSAAYTRADGLNYVLPVVMDGNYAVCTLSRTETACAGVVRLQISWIQGELVAKTALFEGYIELGIVDEDEELDSPEETVLEQMQQYAAATAASADAAASSASAAAQSAQAAQEAAQTALGIIDDEAVAADSTWSSKQIIDVLCPPLEETGNPVQCYPVAGYPLGVKASWEPRQEGTGDPSPDNVRPIVGLDSVQVTRCGKNVLDESKLRIQSNYDTSHEAFGFWYYELNLPFGSYTVSAGATYNGGGYLWFGNALYGTSGATGAWFAHQSQKLTTNFTFNDVNKLYVGVSGNMELVTSVLDAVQFIQIEAGSIPTAYEPYTGTTATLDLPSTGYGGEVDLATGEGVKTWEYIASYNGESIASEWISDRDVYLENATPTTGAAVAYKLATPVPITATGSQSLPALSGQNVLTTNADSLTVTGRADPTHTIQVLTDRIAALETAAVEGGTTT